MRRILGFSKAVEALGDFELSEFRIVRELRFYEIENEAQNPRVDLVLESDDRSPNYRLTLAFGGVSGLKIDDFGGPQTRVTGLEVVDIANRQWEGISWEIRDFENSALAFRAASAELTAVIALTT
jgi:hypothetical protein